SLGAVSTLQADGETALWDALALAGSRMQAVGAERPYVVVLSDGANSAGVADQAQAVATLSAAGAAVYAIAIDSPDIDAAALRSTVDSVGGQFFTAADVGGLQALYTDIAGRLASRYELTYRSATPAGRSLVLSVAAGGAIATAEARVAATGPVTAGPVPAGVLNAADQPTLGAVTVEPGVLASTWLRLVGIVSLVAALVIMVLLAAAPAVRVRLDAANGAGRAVDNAVDSVAGVNGRLAGAADRFVARRDGSGELDLALDSAGINLRPGEFVLAWLVAVVASAVIFTLVAGLIVGTAIAAGVAAGIVGYVRLRTARRRQQFADQLVDTLSIVSSGLRAGRGLPQALELVAEEAASPTAEEFRRVMFEVRVGLDLTTALAGVARRMRSDDLNWVTRAIDINRELGGDLTEVLGNVADTIRDRRRVARQVKSLSAEGRATGWVLMALPFLMFAFIAWRNPGSVELLTGTGLGRLMLGGALASMACGFFWVRKLVAIRY
ncbi:MAG: type II secretion system F family protein, partial [Acidimicrobiia bacterium]|nr:type II secretion system F family protein [Acidimicrobiia bacterium]